MINLLQIHFKGAIMGQSHTEISISLVTDTVRDACRGYDTTVILSFFVDYKQALKEFTMVCR